MWPCSQQFDMAGEVDLGLPKPDLDMAFPNDDDSNETTPIAQAISLSQDPSGLGKTTNHSIPRISADDAYQILPGTAPQRFDQTLVLDCRFKHEYDGGHIVGAMNITTYKQLLSLYKKYKGQNVCMIFHCEFSQKRGPTWVSLFRDIDRNDNVARYPALSYNNVYLLEGGYKAFYTKHKDMCIGGYTTMEDDGTDDKSVLKKANTQYKREIKRHVGPHTPPVSKSRQTLRIPLTILRSISFSYSQPNK